MLHKCHKEKATGSVAVTESYRSNYRNRSIYFYNIESNHFRRSSTNHCVLEIFVIKCHLILPVTYSRSTLYYFLTYELTHRSTHADLTTQHTHALTHTHAQKSIRSLLKLRPIACWECRFESRRREGCLSLVNVVFCQVEVSATSRSLVQRSHTDCGVSLCVIS